MKKEYLINLIAIIFVLGLIFLYNLSKNKQLGRSHRYTIGKVYDFGNRFRGGIDILYNFKVEGVLYKDKMPSVFLKEERLELLNKYYLIKFNPESPDLNTIYFDKPIKDSLLQAPSDGWDTEPDIK